RWPTPTRTATAAPPPASAPASRYSASFFFQAEDGIRARTVTGVQTCALPIWWPDQRRPGRLAGRPRVRHHDREIDARRVPDRGQIGRASCRERAQRREVGRWGEEEARGEGAGATARPPDGGRLPAGVRAAAIP